MKEIIVQLSLDGDQWCCLIGNDLQDGVAGFGDTPGDAFRALGQDPGLYMWVQP